MGASPCDFSECTMKVELNSAVSKGQVSGVDLFLPQLVKELKTHLLGDFSIYTLQFSESR